MFSSSGKILMSLAALVTAFGPLRTDWSDSHIFSPHWPPHARFHTMAGVGMAIILSPTPLWLLWRHS